MRKNAFGFYPVAAVTNCGPNIFSCGTVHPNDDSKEFIKEWAPDYKVDEYIVSAIIQAEK